MTSQFKQLNEKIENCQLCSTFQQPLKKTSVVNRGGVSPILIVGRNPGNKELESTEPFSGVSGQKLDSWLVECGNPVESPRKNVYMTSVIKCFCGTTKSTFKKMSQNCAQILNEQIALVQPSLVISLGEDSFDAIKFVNASFAEAVFKIYSSKEQDQNVFFPKWGHEFSHLVWPHPSPLSRKLNEDKNKVLLKSTFKLVNKYLED